MLCLWLAAPSPVLAGSVVYFGPILQPGNTESPSVAFTVYRNENKKPVELRRFSVYEPMAQPCPASDELHFPFVKFPQEDLPLPIRKGSFSGRAEDLEGDFFEITGVVPRKGTARGTVQLTTTIHLSSGDSYCDTGVLPWEATIYKKPGY